MATEYRRDPHLCYCPPLSLFEPLGIYGAQVIILPPSDLQSVLVTGDLDAS